MQRIAKIYSEPNARLYPHVQAVLGLLRSSRMSPFVTCGAGFLLAVLWMDLMFDVQVLRDRENPLQERTLASIASYYARVTTAARPMNRLIAAVMLATIAAAIVEITEAAPSVVGSLGLARPAAASRCCWPAAGSCRRRSRLGSREDPPGRQSELARAICREHILCACLIAALIALQLAFS